jgi:hypothetical protein
MAPDLKREVQQSPKPTLHQAALQPRAHALRPQLRRAIAVPERRDQASA